MNEKKRKTEEFDPWSPWEQDTYQTGSTCPPKSYGGLIAFLLVLVIFLCGLSTALGLMNIRLFRQLNASAAEGKESPVAFSQALDEARADTCYPLGFSAQDIPELWGLYQDLPQGVYITEVDDNSDAAAKGVAPGDILLRVDGVAVSNTAELNQFMNANPSRSTAQVVIYRAGKQLSFTLRLTNVP